MKATAIAILCVTISGIPLATMAQEKVDFGKQEYEASCAACHGMKGKGDGPVSGFTKDMPADLTVLAKNNGGVFPMERVYNVIDGEQVVKEHGTRDMPIWGQRYRKAAVKYYSEYYLPYNEEAFVRARILALAEYIDRLQVK